MKWKFILSLVLLSILSISWVNADIVSINSYGSEEIVMSSSKEIEGFFFGQIIEEESQGNYVSITDKFLDKDFICKIYTDSQNVTEIQFSLLDKYNTFFDIKSLEEYILRNCQEFKEKKTYIIIYILIFLVLFLAFISYFNRKRILVLIGRKKRIKNY